jgi:hypothetical protein
MKKVVECSKLSQNLDTGENKRFWNAVNKAAKEVAMWPEWKRNIRL